MSVVKTLNDGVDLSRFDCSKQDELGLNSFFHKEALKYQQEGMGVTHLFYRNRKLVGYVTVAMGSIRKEKTTLQIDNYDKVNYPALWLGRLAVDNTEREKGIGTRLLKYCINLAIKKAKKEIGCRFVVLVTKKGFRTDFYTRHGFKKSNVKLEKDLVLLYFQLF